jgi:hypothetical protein
MMQAIGWMGWFGRAKRERSDVRRIADAYLAWLECCHPFYFDAHVDSLVALRDAASLDEIAVRIARLDQLVARAA